LILSIPATWSVFRAVSIEIRDLVTDSVQVSAQGAAHETRNTVGSAVISPLPMSLFLSRMVEPVIELHAYSS
jgi:hypothetical protein